MHDFTVPDSVTPIVAWRYWRLGHDRLLRSLTGRHQAWARRAEAIVKAVTHYNDPAILAEVSKGLGEAMVGIGMESLAEDQLLARRGW